MTSINESYLDLCKHIIENGKTVFKDDAEILETLGNKIIIDNPLGLKYKARYSFIKASELLTDIEKGEYEIEGCPIKGDALYHYVNSLNNPQKGGFTYTYPDRLMGHFGVNQIETMLDRLENHLGSNRSIAVTLDPKLDSSQDDIPCLQLIQAVVRNRELQLHCFFRSNDIFGAYYSNMYFLTYIGMRLVEELNLRDPVNANIVFGGLVYYSSSAHIYRNDFNSAKAMVGL